MEVLAANQAYSNLKTGIRNKTFRYPTKSEPSNYHDGAIFPRVIPRFGIEEASTVFTIGSCFARNIESILVDHGLSVPVSQFQAPAAEIPHHPTHLLNEYNAGTILQRLESVVGLFTYKDDMGVEETPEGFLDLFLHIGAKPVSKARLVERRGQIADLYKAMLASETIIITLGLIECWYDNLHGCYLNKAPSQKLIAREPGRFSFHRFEVNDVIERMMKAITLLNSLGSFKILLTVSPIPVEATFTSDNAVVANSYAKSVLRVAVESLRRTFGNVDYFPSFEIVTSGGSPVFTEDNIHVSGDIIVNIMKHLVKLYMPDHVSPKGLYYEALELLMSGTRSDRLFDVMDKLSGLSKAGWYLVDLKGHLASMEGRDADALAHAREAFSFEPAHPGLAVRLANLEEKMGNIAEAEKLFAAAADTGDDHARRSQEAFMARRLSASSLPSAPA